MKTVINEKEVMMEKSDYLARIRHARNRGQVMALLMVGKSISEISEILGLQKSYVKSIIKSMRR